MGKAAARETENHRHTAASAPSASTASRTRNHLARRRMNRAAMDLRQEQPSHYKVRLAPHSLPSYAPTGHRASSRSGPMGTVGPSVRGATECESRGSGTAAPRGMSNGVRAVRSSRPIRGADSLDRSIRCGTLGYEVGVLGLGPYQRRCFFRDVLDRCVILLGRKC